MDVCAVLRGALKEKRIGHSGTLDPMATGLLVVFLGRATRAVQFAEAHSKTYEALLRPGIVTDTQDTSGTVLETRPAAVTDAEIAAVLPRFRGEILQVPPMYSALKVGGQKLYDLARKGREVERQPRPVTVFSLEQTGRRTLAVAGGVAANSRIRAELEREVAQRGVRLCMPPLSLCGDNGAMIGSQAYYEYLAGHTADQTLNAYATKSILGEQI